MTGNSFRVQAMAACRSRAIRARSDCRISGATLVLDTFERAGQFRVLAQDRLLIDAHLAGLGVESAGPRPHTHAERRHPLFLVDRADPVPHAFATRQVDGTRRASDRHARFQTGLACPQSRTAANRSRLGSSARGVHCPCDRRIRQPHPRYRGLRDAPAFHARATHDPRRRAGIRRDKVPRAEQGAPVRNKDAAASDRASRGASPGGSRRSARLRIAARPA